MKVRFRKSFVRDLKKIKDSDTRDRIRQVIEQVESARNLRDIGNVKKLTGPGNFLRIRVGDYRVGLAVEKDAVEFIRCLPRRDLYRYFP